MPPSPRVHRRLVELFNEGGTNRVFSFPESPWAEEPEEDEPQEEPNHAMGL
jgi:hypothetical protein